MLLSRQTNILSAAFIIMATVILSQILGLVRTRLLFSIFGPSNTLGIYNYASILPDTIFQLTIAAALASAFIPVFSEYLSKGQEKDAHKMASTLLVTGITVFVVFSLVLVIFAPKILAIFNGGQNFSKLDMILMANLMRVIVVGQLIYIVGTFISAILQSYNHFFIPGIAAAFYNIGIIIGILLLHQYFGIYAVPLGIILGASIFVMLQVPFAKKVGFSFIPSFNFHKSQGISKIVMLMWPRTIQVGVQQIGTIILAAIIAFMAQPGRTNLLFDSAKTLMFAPISLIGLSIAQAAFPVLSREKNNLADFKMTFITSFNQMLYLILPASIIILVLRIPIVRLAYGADKFDWPATVLTGHILAFLSFSIFAQALIVLFYRAFYALHDSVVPLLVSAASTLVLIILGYYFVIIQNMGIESIAFAFSLANVLQLIILIVLLDKKVGGFPKILLFFPPIKIFIATFLMGISLYIPIKLLDQLVFDTTRTINLIFLAGTSSLIGLSFYLFLTWLFNVKEASTFLLIFKKIGNWKEILGKSDEVIDGTRMNP
ncbi:MAG: Integral membrane protein MviN [Candidatus Levybacteria bacterium GW2011_GWA2_37_36]|nr:MAG: Integral membrane protein MviN [Candidatus Levybacteria bacterium GW2011_GWA2_37_36]KKQ38458.1 MAG: Integral membrane protein MviN [Candidatus Levybacteria bacterium GW2011_GWC2_37_7]KKQ42973.1 MAG: Integral membrane protein MviN [Candidatus Levybacteria bacterium GW2011_GWB1_37_8]